LLYRIWPQIIDAMAVPTRQRLRLDDHHCLEDRWKPSIELNEEEPIVVGELDATALLAPQDGQLMPKRGILCLKLAFRPGWHTSSRKRER
jgi:hypothetical protein